MYVCLQIQHVWALHTCSDIWVWGVLKPLTYKTFDEVDNIQRGDTKYGLPVNYQHNKMIQYVHVKTWWHSYIRCLHDTYNSKACFLCKTS